MIPWIAAGWACETPTTVREVAVTLNKAIDAFFDLESDRLKAASVELRRDVECLGEPVQQRQAADVHRVEALVSFLDRDAAATLAHLRAAILIEPDYDFRELVPADHPLAKLHRQALADLSAGARPIEMGPERTAFWDGYVPGVFDLGWTGLLQLSDTRGNVLQNDWIEPGEPLPKPPAPPDRPPARAVLSVSVGLRSLLGNPAFEGDPLAVDLVRLRVGTRRAGWALGGALAVSGHQGKDLSVQLAQEGRIYAPGDAVLLSAGVVGGRVVPAGAITMEPALELGIAYFQSPMTEAYWQANVASVFDTSRAITPTELGPYAGLSLLFRASKEAPVHLYGGLGVDGMLVGKPLFAADVRGGFETTF